MLASVSAFTANVRCGAPEVHLAYDSTPGRVEREFVEVFLPDEQGLPRAGRLINTGEFTAVFEAIDRSDETNRISRALNQYELALRFWYLGGEYLALSHLYMAVEALTKAVIRVRCAADDIDEAELARRNNIDPDDPERPRWRPALETWARHTLIFQSDKKTYDAARTASDGVEHGFMEMNEVHKRAVSATEATFLYVRTAILGVLGIDDDEEFHELHARPPRDVQSLRKMVRGKFIGEQDDIAPPGEEYPYLEWRSNIRTITRTGDEFSLTYNEHFTVRCHPDVGFQGLAFEARGRLQAGQSPMTVEVGQEIDLSTGEEPTRETVLNALERASSFAATLGKSVGERGVSGVQALSVLRHSMQLALFESIHSLLRDDRAPEALVLMHGLIRNTCLLQLSSRSENGAAVAIQARLDGLDRNIALHDDGAVADHAALERDSLERAAASAGIQLPHAMPDLSSAPFYADHAKDAALVEEVALSDLAAIQLHLEAEEGRPAFRTQSTDPRLQAGTASLAIGALTTSAIALAEICGHEYDDDLALELLALAETLDPDSDTT